MNGQFCLPGAPIASLKGPPDQCILYGELPRHGVGKIAALATRGAPPPGNLL
ncbi:hypothetical protein P7K49_031996, partial [Saguinus oedipus]